MNFSKFLYKGMSSIEEMFLLKISKKLMNILENLCVQNGRRGGGSEETIESLDLSLKVKDLKNNKQ